MRFACRDASPPRQSYHSSSMAVVAARVREPDVTAEHVLEQVKSPRLDLVMRASLAALSHGTDRAGITALDALGQREREQDRDEERRAASAARHALHAHAPMIACER